MIKETELKNLHKTFKFNELEVKQETRNGVPVGIIEGYASTWDTDRGDDVILQGAFAETLERHAQDGRPIRMLFQHNSDQIIGGFPIANARETEKGLFVRGEINLTAGQQGEFAFSLAKQGVLTDMSIGFNIPSREDVEFREDGDRVIRVIKKVELWEISLVGEPMNPNAQIVSVKKLDNFRDLPMAGRDAAWDRDCANERVKEFTGSDDLDLDLTLFADVVDGELKAVPRAIFSAAAVLIGARTGDIDEAAKSEIAANVEAYYSKLDLDSPFRKSFGADVTIAESCQNVSDVEQLLKFLGLSSNARKCLISTLKNSEGREDLGGADEAAELSRIVADFKSRQIKREIQQSLSRLGVTKND